MAQKKEKFIDPFPPLTRVHVHGRAGVWTVRPVKPVKVGGHYLYYVENDIQECIWTDERQMARVSE